MDQIGPEDKAWLKRFHRCDLLLPEVLIQGGWHPNTKLSDGSWLITSDIDYRLYEDGRCSYYGPLKRTVTEFGRKEVTAPVNRGTWSIEYRLLTKPELKTITARYKARGTRPPTRP